MCRLFKSKILEASQNICEVARFLKSFRTVSLPLCSLLHITLLFSSHDITFGIHNKHALWADEETTTFCISEIIGDRLV